MTEGRVHIATDGKEAYALCDTETFLRLSGDRISPAANMWKRIASAANAGEIDLSVVPLKERSSGIVEITEAEEEALHSAGYDSWEMPEEVARSVERKAEDLGLGAGEIMDLVIRNRRDPDTLCILDIEHGFKLAEKMVRRRAGV